MDELIGQLATNASIDGAVAEKTVGIILGFLRSEGPSDSVQTLIDKLRDLSATKFVEKAGGEPVFDATITSNNGKRVEKVTIRKQGTQYFAQRENEPSIYELDAKAVEDLEKAAADVKEAAPEATKKK